MLMTCNYMTEGCSGGWSIFAGFLTEGGHMVSEQCAPYIGTTLGQKCQKYSTCPPLAKVQESRYIGGYNYLPSEKLIQKELLRNGPLITSFAAGEDFSYYKTGILTQKNK